MELNIEKIKFLNKQFRKKIRHKKQCFIYPLSNKIGSVVAAQKDKKRNTHTIYKL